MCAPPLPAPIQMWPRVPGAVRGMELERPRWSSWSLEDHREKQSRGNILSKTIESKAPKMRRGGEHLKVIASSPAWAI